MNLSVAAAERDSTSGEGFSTLLSSVCCYKSFPFEDIYDDEEGVDDFRSNFLLDLYLHVQACEAKTAKSLLPTFQQIYQSAPAFWSIDLSKRKVSIFLEVLKLQTQKRPVELRGWSDEESEVRSFLQCLPCISQLRCVKLFHSRKPFLSLAH